jgi:DNA adenine methylase
MSEYIKSPFKYTGRKINILDQILPYFPDLKEHRTFVDVFAGSGDVSINIPEGIDIIWNDIQAPLISYFEELKNYDDTKVKSSEFIKIILNGYEDYYKQTYFDSESNKDIYYEIRDNYNENKNPFILLLLSYMSFNNMIRFNSKDKFNNSYGYRTFSEDDIIILDKFVEVLKNKYISFWSCEFDILIDNIISGYSESEVKPFLYLDPPYLITSAPYSRYWNEAKEQLLYNKLSELTNKGFRWALSNVLEHDGKINKILDGFLLIEQDSLRVIEIDKNYNFSSGRKRDKKESKEILVLNY